MANLDGFEPWIHETLEYIASHPEQWPITRVRPLQGGRSFTVGYKTATYYDSYKHDDVWELDAVAIRETSRAETTMEMDLAWGSKEEVLSAIREMLDTGDRKPMYYLGNVCRRLEEKDDRDPMEDYW